MVYLCILVMSAVCSGCKKCLEMQYFRLKPAGTYFKTCAACLDNNKLKRAAKKTAVAKKKPQPYQKQYQHQKHRLMNLIRLFMKK